MAKSKEVKPQEIDLEKQKRINFFDKGRDDTMSFEEYKNKGIAKKDLGKKKGGIDVAPGKARQAYLKSEEGKEEKKRRKEHNKKFNPNMDKETKKEVRKRAKKADIAKGREILDSRRNGGTKHIMELPTNVPRLQSGAILGDLDKDGKLSGYEKVRQAAIEKNMKK